MNTVAIKTAGAVSRIAAPSIDPETRKAAEAVFSRAKQAVVNGDLAAFRKELHSTVFKAGTPEQIAVWFGELRGSDIRGWQMGELQSGSDGLFAIMNNAPANSGAAFDFDGKELKLLFLGTIRWP